MFREFKFDNTRFDDGNKKRMIKIVFVGPSGSGKTTIINQFVNNHFNKEHIKTNDAVIYKKKYNLYQSKDDVEEICYIDILDTMDITKEEDGSGEFFEDLKKNLHVYSFDGKFRQRNGQILKYEYYNLKEKESEKKRDPTDFLNQEKEVKKKEYGIDRSVLGLFCIPRVMAFIHVFDCQMNFDENKNTFESIKVYAQSINKHYEAESELNEKKPLHFFIANRYPFYIDKETLSINFKQKKFMTLIDENIEKIKKLFNENPTNKLIIDDEEEGNVNFFIMNAENTRLVHKLFERVVSEINSKPELMNITREEDDQEDKNSDSDNAGDRRNQGIFSFLCCSERTKSKSHQKTVKDDKKQSESYENNETNQGVEEDYLNEINEEENKTNNKLVIKDGKLTAANGKPVKPSSSSDPQSDKGESDENKDKSHVNGDSNKKENGCLLF